MLFSLKFEETFYAFNQYSKQFPVISFVEYKQVVRKVGLSEQYRKTEINLSQSEASAEICLKKERL